MANRGAKDMLFRHCFLPHALLSIGFRSGACVVCTAGAELVCILLIRYLCIYLKYIGSLIFVLIVSYSSYVIGSLFCLFR